MAPLDLVFIGILLFSALVGAWRGLIGEAIALIAWVVALVAAWLFGAGVGDSVFAAIKEPALRTLAGFGLVIGVVLVTMAGIKFLMRSLLKALGLSFTDRLLGVVFGFVRGVVVVLVLVAAGGLTSAPKQSWWKESSLTPPLATVVLALRPMLAPDIAKRIRY